MVVSIVMGVPPNHHHPIFSWDVPLKKTQHAMGILHGHGNPMANRLTETFGQAPSDRGDAATFGKAKDDTMGLSDSSST